MPASSTSLTPVGPGAIPIPFPNQAQNSMSIPTQSGIQVQHVPALQMINPNPDPNIRANIDTKVNQLLNLAGPQPPLLRITI